MKLAILISGRGSNMAALIDYCLQDDTATEAALVISDNPDAKGLQTAKDKNIPAAAIPGGDETEIINAIEESGAELICLAGYMRILSAGFCERYHGRLVNIHPSLLPRHKGLDTHARALAVGDTEHGCSVHFVTPEMDEGPVIARARVAVMDTDTTESLAARVLAEEHKIYPRAVAALAAGLVRLTSDGVAIDTGALPGEIPGLSRPLTWPPEN